MTKGSVYYPTDWFGKVEVVADNEGVTYTYRTLVSNYSTSYSYADLGDTTDEWSQGDEAWSRFSMRLLLIGLLGFVFLRTQLLRTICVGIMSAAGGLYLLRFRRRHWVEFIDTSGNRAFLLERPGCAQVIEFIRERVQHEPRNTSGDAT